MDMNNTDLSISNSSSSSSCKYNQTRGDTETSINAGTSADSVNTEEDQTPHVKHVLPKKTVLSLLLMNVVISCFGNGILPALQSYACLPYGSNIYHLTLTISSSINPIACFLYFFINIKSLKLLLIGVVLYLASAAYTIFIAALSPCPLLVHSAAGGITVVSKYICSFTILIL